MNRTSSEEKQLIEALTRGDAIAYHWAVRHYSPIMHRTAAAIAGQAVAVQEGLDN